MFNNSSHSLTVAQQKTAAEVLAQAFAEDTFMAYLFPDSTTRIEKLKKIFLPVIRLSLRAGGIEIAPGSGGVLLWISGESFSFKLLHLIQSGLIWMPWMIGQSAFKRLKKHDMACEDALIRHAPKDFAYLLVVGVHPNATGQGLGKQMIYSAMETIRQHGHSACFLRTENPKNVGLYKHLGFEQVLTEIPADSGLQYWLMSQTL